MSALVGAVSLALMAIGAMRVLRMFAIGSRRALAGMGRALAKLEPKAGKVAP